MSISRTEVARETSRRMRRFGFLTGEDPRRMRTDAGVSLAALGNAVGASKAHLSRIESSQGRPSLELLTAIGVALGADLSVRYYPGSGPRLHDRFQAPMVETLLRALDPRWTATLEVPVLKPARGVIDLVLEERSSGLAIACEVQSELRRLEQQIRWGAEKADGLATRLVEDDPSGSRHDVSKLLVLRSTTATRDLARRFEQTLATAYPARTGDIVDALTTSTAPWPGAGIVWMSVHGSKASLMTGAPRFVSLGRS